MTPELPPRPFVWPPGDKGIGSVIMGIFDEAKAARLLNLPEGRELAALIPVGYPDEAPAAPRRKPAEELLTFQN